MAASIGDLVGRERELATLCGLLDAAHEPTVAAISGDAGIGKTALSLATAEAAKARGYLVLSCRPSEAEVRFSFAGLADLIGGVLPALLPQLPPPQRRALDAALGLSESDTTGVDEGLVAFAFLNALRKLAADNRVLLSIDDIQWLDAPSLAMLRFALSRLDKEAVLAILTIRGTIPSWLPRTVSNDRLITIELGPLSLGALREILRARVVNFPIPRPTLVRIWETSGGNPFFALELARALQRRGGRLNPGDDLPLPANLNDLIAERLDHLGADELNVVQVVAALAEPTVRLVEAAAGDTAVTGLAAALGAGVLQLDGNRLHFTHPLLRSAVASRTAPVARLALHAELAKLVTDPEERARHLALATTSPNREVAALVEEAAEKVGARGGPAAAAELAELAVQLTPPEDADDRQRRVMLAADRYREAGDGQRAIALLEQAHKELPAGTARAAVLLRLALALEDFVGLPGALDRYREALAEAQGDDALLAEIHLNLAHVVKMTEERNLGLEHAAFAVEASSRVGNPALRSRALATHAQIHFRSGRGISREEMEEALDLERSLQLAPSARAASWAHLYQLVWSGDLVGARRLADQLREALSLREDRDEAEALWFLSVIEWRAGNWELAARHATDSLAIRSQFGLEGTLPIEELPAALIAAHRGDIEDARARSQRALARAEADGIRIGQSGHRWVLGFIELSLGDPARALDYLERGWELRDSVFLLEPGHRFELADTLEALIAVGRLDDAEQKLVGWEERSRRLDRPWALAITARCRALVLAARGNFASAQSSFQRALAEHGRTQDPFQHARTLFALGITQRRAKQRGAARQTLDDALARFEQLGAPLWAEKARTEIRRIGGRTPSGSALTEGERRIAVLVAEGRTNRDVAAALFVTEHTVEGALTRAYHKLGVRSRSELVAHIRRES